MKFMISTGADASTSPSMFFFQIEVNGDFLQVTWDNSMIPISHICVSVVFFQNTKKSVFIYIGISDEFPK